MQKVIVLKDGPHRLSPISYWGITYAQRLLQLNGPWTPAGNNVALLAALLSEAEDKNPDMTPVKEWGFAEAADLIVPVRPKVKNGRVQLTRLEVLLNELYDAGFSDEDAAPDDEAPADDAVPPTPRPGAAKQSRSPRSPKSTSTSPGE